MTTSTAWTPMHTALMLALVGDFTDREIGELLERSTVCITAMRLRYGGRRFPIPPGHVNCYWSADEDVLLLDLMPFMSSGQIGALVGRSAAAIINRISILRRRGSIAPVPEGRARPVTWTADQDQQLLQLAPFFSNAEIANYFGDRTAVAVKFRLQRVHRFRRPPDYYAKRGLHMYYGMPRELQEVVRLNNQLKKELAHVDH